MSEWKWRIAIMAGTGRFDQRVRLKRPFSKTNLILLIIDMKKPRRLKERCSGRTGATYTVIRAETRAKSTERTVTDLSRADRK